MSDVAFLLLIFFLSTTIFDFEVGIPMVLPGLQASPVSVERRNVLTIRTDERGAITIDSAPVIPAQIEGIVRERLAMNPDLIVKIETDPTVPYEMMIQVLDHLIVGHNHYYSFADEGLIRDFVREYQQAFKASIP